MSELHERLMARVAEFTDDRPLCAGDPPWFCGADDYELAVAATRAVVVLHSPIPCRCTDNAQHTICGGCPGHERADRCRTLRSVAAGLGIEP